MHLIDTHAHVNFNAFKEDSGEIIRSSLQENVWMINVGSEYRTSRRALEMANKYEKGVYAAIGLHPIHLAEQEYNEDGGSFTTRAEEWNYDAYEKLARFEKVVAIGEIGLDYFHIDKGADVQKVKDRQKEVFLDQLLMARRLNKPVIIHCRQAHDDMLEMLEHFKKEYKELMPAQGFIGVMHCFSGDEDLAWKYFSYGLMISFTGLITFSRQWDSLIRRLPADRFMIETDCPFMTPEPYRGQRNQPLLVKFVAQRIAEIRNTEIERIAEITTRNARILFGI
jgi:TatD DNase family protein